MPVGPGSVWQKSIWEASSEVFACENVAVIDLSGCTWGFEDVCQPHTSPALLSCPFSGGDEDANPGVLAPKSLCKAAVEHCCLF